MKRIEAGERVLVAKGNDPEGLDNVYQRVLPGFEEEVAGLLTERKRGKIGELMTNVDGEVHAFKDKMPGILAGALTARSSRSPESDIGEVLWQEFLTQGKLGEEMIQRILDQFGDDSVREDASAYLAVRNHSVLASMEVFWHPLLTGIEMSTRYINWRARDADGFFHYVRPEAVMNSEYGEVYVGAMDRLFESYDRLWEPVWEHVVGKFPREEGVSEKAYADAVKGKVCDILRKLLPLGIETNFVIHGTYRTLSEVIMNMRASENGEVRTLADQMARELKEVNPRFVGVVDTHHGQAWVEHKREQAGVVEGWVGKEVSESREIEAGVRVRVINEDYVRDFVRGVVARECPGLSEKELDREVRRKLGETGIRGWLKKLGIGKTKEVEKLVSGLEGTRTNRRHKVHGAFQGVGVEVAYEGISMSGYKDLNRHRNIWDKSEPDWGGEMGYYVPPEIIEIGGWVEEEYRGAQEVAREARQLLKNDFPREARLLLTHGSKTKFTVWMGLGESIWIEELRSIASGDPEYRWFAQEESRQRRRVAAALARAGSFVDFNAYDLGRIREAVRADLRGRQA